MTEERRKPSPRRNSSKPHESGRKPSRRRPSAARRHDAKHREDKSEKVLPPGLEPEKDEPETPKGYEDATLPRGLKAELRSLNKPVADKVAAHLMAAGDLIEEDPDLALRHANVARRLASRIPIVREAVAEIAYEVGDFVTALTEYRAIHRMKGSDDYLPIIAECERAVGKTEAALRTVRQAKKGQLSGAQRTEVVIVEACIRRDLGQIPEAARLLKVAIEDRRGTSEDQARLRYAYADLLERGGKAEVAQSWFESAQHYDVAEELDAAQRISTLKGGQNEAH